MDGGVQGTAKTLCSGLQRNKEESQRSIQQVITEAAQQSAPISDSCKHRKQPPT